MPRKAKRFVSEEARANMRRGQLERQAKRRAHQGYTEAIAEVALSSLSAAAVAPATEISFVKSSVLARKEEARKTIEDCDALLAAWERLGL